MRPGAQGLVKWHLSKLRKTQEVPEGQSVVVLHTQGSSALLKVKKQGADAGAVVLPAGVEGAPK